MTRSRPERSTPPVTTRPMRMRISISRGGSVSEVRSLKSEGRSRRLEVRSLTSIGSLARIAVVAALMLAAVLRVGSAAQTLDMYFIDVEGGQSTLIVTPAGESLLIDTGYGGSE